MNEIQEYIFLVEFYLEQWEKEKNPIFKQYFKEIYFNRKQHLAKLIFAKQLKENNKKEQQQPTINN